MRQRRRWPVPVPTVLTLTWLSPILLTWQVAQAVEQRSLLRAGRAAKAMRMPFITLPQSLLLQSSDGIEETAHEFVDKARSAFFTEAGEADTATSDTASTETSGSTETSAKLSATAKSSIASSSSKSSGASASSNGTVVSNTSASNGTSGASNGTSNGTSSASNASNASSGPSIPAVNVQDAAEVARQLNITLDRAKARNLLVQMIGDAQLDLLRRIEDINFDLDATEARALGDLTALNHSFNYAQSLPIMSANAKSDVQKIKTASVNLKETVPQLLLRAHNATATMEKYTNMSKTLSEGLNKSKKLPGAQKRVQANRATMKTLLPRLQALERRVTKMEGWSYDGDIDKVVDEMTNKEVVNIMEDVSRGFGRFFDENQVTDQ